MHRIRASRSIAGLFRKEHEVARKTFVVTFLSICLMMAIPSGWAALEGASESPQNSTDLSGNTGFVEGFFADMVQEMLQAAKKDIADNPSQGDLSLPGSYIVPKYESGTLPTEGVSNFIGGDDNFDSQISNENGDLANVPEPSTLFLLGSGVLGLGILGRRKLNK